LKYTYKFIFINPYDFPTYTLVENMINNAKIFSKRTQFNYSIISNAEFNKYFIMLQLYK